jgi:hypothetical protein
VQNSLIVRLATFSTPTTTSPSRLNHSRLKTYSINELLIVFKLINHLYLTRIFETANSDLC